MSEITARRLGRGEKSSAQFSRFWTQPAHETENLIRIFDVYPIIRGPAISVHHPVLTVEADPAKQARE